MTVAKETQPVDFGERLARVRGQRAPSKDADHERDTEQKASAAKQAVDAVHMLNPELWHSGSDGYISLMVGGVPRTLAIRSSDFADLLGLIVYQTSDKPLASDALRAAQNTLAAEARYAGPEYPVYSRIAHHAGDVWVDLGDQTGQAVQITVNGWEVVEASDVPIKFVRSRSALALPIPERSGSFTPLRTIFPQIDDEAETLVLGWLVGCFQPQGARAFCELVGGQGSGKSTIARYLVSLVDPATVPARALPRDEQALLIATKYRAVLAFDNLSVISPEMSDAFCRISTGAGIGQRALFTNDEEVLLLAILPLLWTCIEPQAVRRPDLQDRTISISIGALDDSTLTEHEVDEAFQDVYPQLLGALYDAVSCALRRRSFIRLDRLPRLADFALWVEAAAPALGWEDGRFIDVLEGSRTAANALAVEANITASAVVTFMKARMEWEGTAAELLVELRSAVDDENRRARAFPRDATRLSGQLKRLQRPLLAVGIGVGFHRTKASRTIRLDRLERSPGEHQVKPSSMTETRSPAIPLGDDDSFWAERNAIYGAAYRGEEI